MQALQESVGPASAVPLLEAAHTTGDGRLLAQCRRFVADNAAEVRASGGVEQLRDLGVAKGLLGDALDRVAEEGAHGGRLTRPCGEWPRLSIDARHCEGWGSSAMRINRLSIHLRVCNCIMRYKELS